MRCEHNKDRVRSEVNMNPEGICEENFKWIQAFPYWAKLFKTLKKDSLFRIVQGRGQKKQSVEKGQSFPCAEGGF